MAYPSYIKSYDPEKVERMITEIDKVLDQNNCNYTEVKEIFARIRWTRRDD